MIVAMADSGQVLIIGAGMAGLACAKVLGENGIRSTIFEASNRVGGRLGSETLDGFTLDRGFQIFLTSYPEARRQLDYDGLYLKKFRNGAIVRQGGRFHRFVDPRRRPSELPTTALSSLASLGDKFKVLRATTKIANGGLPHESTIDRLKKTLGFSDQIIERFFRPFFAGVFLENELATSSRMFDFTYLQFAAGEAALPARGMQAIADQMAGRLVKSEIVTGCAIQAVDGRTIHFANGGRATGRAVVVAVDATAAAKLLPSVPMPRAEGWTGTTCVYFAADRSPVGEPILVLNADDGPINNIVVLSDISPAYAPPGQSLVVCTVLGDHADIEAAVQNQLRTWYGSVVDRWRHLKTFRIPHALPNKSVAAMGDPHRRPRVGDGLYLCGDHCDFASLNGALNSGRRAAEAILADLA